MTAPSGTPGFKFDLSGRLRNVSLPPSLANSLNPLFEAVSNSIHAIEARFPEKPAEHGRIVITVIRRDGEDGHQGSVIGFTVRDNGIGLNPDNMGSFCTSDSLFKRKKGGKGIGRLLWLKAFDECVIESIFGSPDGLFRRTFTFKMDDSDPISNHSVDPVESASVEIGTVVELRRYHEEYEAHCPKKSETIASRLVGHFLPYLVVNRMPSTRLIDEAEATVINDFYALHQKRNDISIVTSDFLPGSEFELHHILLEKKLRFLENGLHWMFFAGNDRVVSQAAIDSQIGLKYIGDDIECVYVGLVTSPYLDRHVNQERTDFSMTESESKAVHKAAVGSAKGFLSAYIDRLRSHQFEKAASVIRANPQFLPFRENLEEFVKEKLSLNVQTEEEIYVELSRHRLRRKRGLDRDIVALRNSTYSEKVEESVKRISEALNSDKVGSLAEYVVRRKEILELLDSNLSYRDPDTRNFFREEVVHELICPVRSGSEELSYDDHNLWILDDRLAFYTFFRSDKPFRTFVEGSASGKEPDIAVMFDRSLAFRRQGADEPIIIIEFKKPGRDDYNGNSNPVVQVLEYVDEFRNGSSVRDCAGREIKPIDKSTRFICYVVADFTDTLKKVVRSSIAHHRSADGQGFFGYSEEHNAFVEVMPYSKVLHDARIRNEAFFKRLELI